MKYLIYCRKSTEDKKKQVLSLSSQKHELESIAKKLNLNVVGIYSEEKSAKKLGRSEFAKMIKDISDGKADAILS